MWATYMRKDENNGLGTLSIPSLRLKLNLNKVHGDFLQKTDVKTRYVHSDGLCQDTLEAEKETESMKNGASERQSGDKIDPK